MRDTDPITRDRWLEANVELAKALQEYIEESEQQDSWGSLRDFGLYLYHRSSIQLRNET